MHRYLRFTGTTRARGKGGDFVLRRAYVSTDPEFRVVRIDFDDGPGKRYVPIQLTFSNTSLEDLHSLVSAMQEALTTLTQPKEDDHG